MTTFSSHNPPTQEFTLGACACLSLLCCLFVIRRDTVAALAAFTKSGPSEMRNSKSQPTVDTRSTSRAILSAQDVVKSYGSQPVLDGLSITIHEGERLGLIGQNGCGKSTLLKILAGVEETDDGRVTRRQGLRLGYLAQACRLDPSDTIRDVLDKAHGEVRVLLAEHDETSMRIADSSLSGSERKRLQNRYDVLHHELELRDAWNLDHHVRRVRVALNLPPEGRMVGSLSGGERRRVELAATLLPEPEVLLLDEPTNHIDTDSVEWIESFLSGWRGCCLLVTHDRYFLERVVNRVVEIEDARLYSFPGNYTSFLEFKLKAQESEAKSEDVRRATLAKELLWLQRGPKARTTKQKARIERYHALAQAGSVRGAKQTVFRFPKPPRLGKKIVETKSISFAFGDTILFHDLSLIMQKGMRLGIVGPNGCGKTTLINVLMGEMPPTSGSVDIGDSTQFLYVDQRRAEMDPDMTVLDFVSDGAMYLEVNGNRMYVPSYLESFLFDGAAVRAPMRNLSGGEHNRIDLARKFLQGGNVLVLDEPTNDLDLPTLRVLEDAVLAFEGCAIIVSHDRYFLNRLCTHLLVFDNGNVHAVTGNYGDYLLFMKQRCELEEAAVEKPKAARRKRAPKTKRLTYMEKKELEGMEAAIETREAEIECIEALTGEEDFFKGDHAEVQRVLGELNVAKEGLEALYARWSELDEGNEAP